MFSSQCRKSLQHFKNVPHSRALMASFSMNVNRYFSSVSSHRAPMASVMTGSQLFSSSSVKKNISSGVFNPLQQQQKRNYSSELPDGAQFIEMSALSPTMEQGNLVSWVKKEGDRIDAGDALCQVQTDKATMEMEFQEEGYLAKILVEGGTDNVSIGTPIAIFVEEEEDIEKLKNWTPDDSSSSAAGEKEPAAEKEQAQEAAPKQEESKQAAAPQQQAASSSSSGDRLKASPYARTVAYEKGVNISDIQQGSGPEGRIVAADVEGFTPSKKSAAAAGVAAPATGDYEDIPVTQIRKVIADRLLESKRTVPHYYLTVECEMDELMRIRSMFNKKFEKEGVKLSVNDFILKAAAKAAKAVPEANSSWQGDFIRQYNSVDMSVAVQTDNGLITPIVFDCDKKGLKEISKNVKELAQKAEDGKLQPNEFQGGTFTVSNLGMFGVKEFSAIINPPQACILAIGSAQRKVVESGEGYKTVTTVNVTLSCDHRVVDGAVGAAYLKAFKENITDPINMIA